MNKDSEIYYDIMFAKYLLLNTEYVSSGILVHKINECRDQLNELLKEIIGKELGRDDELFKRICNKRQELESLYFQNQNPKIYTYKEK